MDSGVSFDQIEELRLFYNTKIKNESLDTVLTSIERALREYYAVSEVSDSHTPRQGSSYIDTSQEIAQENYLRATNKLQVSPNNASMKPFKERSF
mgnify:CR=1 FL=1